MRVYSHTCEPREAPGSDYTGLITKQHRMLQEETQIPDITLDLNNQVFSGELMKRELPVIGWQAVDHGITTGVEII